MPSLMPIGTIYEDRKLKMRFRVMAHAPDQFGRMAEVVECIGGLPTREERAAEQAASKATRPPKPPKTTPIPKAPREPKPKREPKLREPRQPRQQKQPKAAKLKTVAATPQTIKPTWRDWLMAGELAGVGVLAATVGPLVAIPAFCGLAFTHGRKARTAG